MSCGSGSLEICTAAERRRRLSPKTANGIEDMGFFGPYSKQRTTVFHIQRTSLCPTYVSGTDTIHTVLLPPMCLQCWEAENIPGVMWPTDQRTDPAANKSLWHKEALKLGWGNKAQSTISIKYNIAADSKLNPVFLFAVHFLITD